MLSSDHSQPTCLNLSLQNSSCWPPPRRRPKSRFDSAIHEKGLGRARGTRMSPSRGPTRSRLMGTDPLLSNDARPAGFARNLGESANLARKMQLGCQIAPKTTRRGAPAWEFVAGERLPRTFQNGESVRVRWSADTQMRCVNTTRPVSPAIMCSPHAPRDSERIAIRPLSAVTAEFGAAARNAGLRPAVAWTWR